MTARLQLDMARRLDTVYGEPGQPALHPEDFKTMLRADWEREVREAVERVYADSVPPIGVSQ